VEYEPGAILLTTTKVFSKLRSRPARCWSSSFAKAEGEVPEQLMDDKDLDSRTEMSHSRSRRTFLYAVGGAGIVSAAGLTLMGAQRSTTKIDHRRSQMESPIEVVRRFCAA